MKIDLRGALTQGATAYSASGSKSDALTAAVNALLPSAPAPKAPAPAPQPAPAAAYSGGSWWAKIPTWAKIGGGLLAGFFVLKLLRR